MIISHKNKFIFVSVPKTASTSIRDCLKDYADVWYHGDKENCIIYEPVNSKLIAKVFEHSRLSDVKELLKPNKYLSFCFVRNPFDIALSNYLFFQESIKFWDKDPKEKKLFIDVYNAYVETLSGTSTFTEWIKKKKNEGWLEIYEWETEQFYWTTGVDFIGKFENLQNDFDIICDKIGIPKQKLPHKNKTKHKHYTEYYDDETREIVAEKYAKDIEYFGYEFGE
jgi:hypothetical protein